MTRYIDADELLERMKRTPRYFDVKHDIEEMPTADVVAREECEKWYHEYHKTKAELRQEKEYHRATEKAADKYFSDLQTAKAEVAREIFEEIERLLEFNTLSGDIFTGKYFDADLENDIAELKKKHTEEKTENES